ncbi:Ulp1 protease family, carboxy-terminal domain protein [Arachis hypogaea]|nr:Ulp1 protease family, carboxy-terminal domain protein [Arachis hypogaea]
MTSIRNNYMCSKVDQVTRVYQAMWCDQHWYLMIIDVAQQKLIYLDSLRDPREADAKKMAMLHVALYLEGMTLGKSWLSGDRVMRPRFSAFEFEEPNVPQQAADFMDCGIWIAQWMIRAYMWQDYEVQHVNAATWMRLAVDLFMKSHNQLAQDFVSKAFAHWQTKTV